MAIGLRPTKIWRQHHQHLLTRTHLDAVQWIYGIDKVPSDDVDDVLASLLEQVWEHRDAIKEFALNEGIRTSITCITTITDASPLFHLMPTTLSRLAYLGVEVSFGIYDYSE